MMDIDQITDRLKMSKHIDSDNRKILILRGKPRKNEGDSKLEPRRGGIDPRLPDLDPVLLSELQGQVNKLVQDLNDVIIDAPEIDGKFQLSEFEVSAGIAVNASGKVDLFLVASGEAGAEVNATMKFVFKRPDRSI